MISNRLAGHELRYEGRVFDAAVGLVNSLVNGRGATRCSCGEWSPVLPSTAARKRWHREHKDAVRAAGEDRDGA